MKITRVKGENKFAELFDSVPKENLVEFNSQPCPFCGNEKPLYNEDTETIVCGQCGIEVFQFFGIAGFDVRDLWNKRK